MLVWRGAVLRRGRRAGSLRRVAIVWSTERKRDRRQHRTRSLSVVNIAGFLIALLLLVTLILRRNSSGRVSFIVECVCLGLIALATGVGHWVIAARMRALRAAMVLPIDQIAADDPRRIASTACTVIR